MLLPVIGTMFKKSSLARVSTVLGSQIAAGVLFLDALGIARHTAQNHVIGDALARAEEAVAGGETAAVAFGREPIFPAMMKEAIATGEAAGTLDAMLDRVARTYEDDVQDTADRLVVLLKPALMLVLGGVVLLIALAVILPLVELMNSLM